MIRGRTVVMTAPGEPFEIREHEIPGPEPGAIVVRITQAGICGSDLLWYFSDLGREWMPPGGMLMGHEGCGVVEALGEGVTTDTIGQPLAEGDRVVHSVVFGCLHCYRRISPSAPLLRDADHRIRNVPPKLHRCHSSNAGNRRCSSSFSSDGVEPLPSGRRHESGQRVGLAHYWTHRCHAVSPRALIKRR